jgi:hypothetical protein
VARGAVIVVATIFLDGFDKYGPPVNALFNPTIVTPPLAQGKWTLQNAFGNPNIAPGLSATGYAVQLTVGSVGSIGMSRTLPTNYARLIGGIRFSAPLAGDCGIVFYDNATPQCSVIIENTSGFIAVKQGSNGTTLQLSSASVAGNTTHYLEYDITFNTGGLGGWTIWLDGVQILSGTGTTRQTANNFANVVQLLSVASAFGSTFIVDDMYTFDPTTAVNNSVLLSNPAVITDFPISDSQTNFINDGNVFGNYYSLSDSSYSMTANTLYLAKFTPNISCTVNDIVILPNTTSVGANFKGVIYADSSGAPGGLLSSGTQVTGCTAGTLLTLPLVTPHALTAGTPYWIGLIGDTTVYEIQFGSALTGFTASNAYSGGAPGSAPAMTGGQNAIVLYGLCTGAATNWASEALNPPIGDVSSVSTSTIGTIDLYNFPALPGSVSTVYTVVVSANCHLSSPGSHTFDTVADSNGSQSGGSNINLVPTINYAWYDSIFELDPHTSASWLPTSVNNAIYGMLMTA